MIDTVIVKFESPRINALGANRISEEEGGSPRHLHDIVLGVVRGGQVVCVDASEVDAMEAGDRLLYRRP